MDKNEFYARYEGDVSKVSRSLARSNPGMDTEDISQQIWLVLFDRTPGQFAVLTDAEPDFVGQVIYRAGHDYCATERYYYTFHSAEYVYTPDDVRTLLGEAFFNPVAWETTPLKEKEISITSGGLCIPLMDIRTAFNALDSDDQKVVRERYEFGIPGDATERSRVMRAVDRMTRTINRNIVLGKKEHEGIGSRTATTNAAALASTKAA